MADRPPDRLGASGKRSAGSKSHGARPHGKRPWKKRPDSKPAEQQRSREPAGYAVRALAVRLVSAVLDRHRALDDALTAEFASGAGAGLEPRDRGLARLIAATVLRRRGELDAVIAQFIEKPLPEDRGLLSTILRCAAAQLLVLGIAPHAVINIAVEQCRHDRGARRFDRLANAVLRRVSERGGSLLAALEMGARLNVPSWVWERWATTYGADGALRIAEASLREASLDLTMTRADEAAGWAERMGGVVLAAGTVRVPDPEARVDALPGFTEGAWWVQDAAASLPARLLGDVAGRDVADLCAAPGGKTAQLAAAGARVTAVDVSGERLRRVRENLTRLNLAADIVTSDVEAWQPGRTFDAVLLDVPCTATGTIRRHPDILHLKRPGDLAALVEIQRRLLDRAAALVRAGGLLVYCTCSLEPAEGELQIAGFLARHERFSRVPIAPGEGAILPDWLTPLGELRTLPHHDPSGDRGLGGMDGFFAARLRCHSA